MRILRWFEGCFLPEAIIFSLKECVENVFFFVCYRTDFFIRYVLIFYKSYYHACMNTFPLFICKANVGRSQIAEWLFNDIHGFWGSLSIAWSEARKDKYLWIPDKTIINFLQEVYWVDICMQKIKYLSDLKSSHLVQITLVIFLYNPLIETFCDDLCKINGLTPYEYFKKKNMPIFIYPVTDPFEIWISWYQKISEEIKIIIGNLKKI